MIQDTPSFKEDHISQIPALHLLQNLGYTYLRPEEALKARGGRAGNVLLESVLVDQLRKLNRIRFKGEDVPFSEANILSAVQSLKEIVYDGLIRTNEKIFDLLTLGRTLTQSVGGDVKSFPLKYIDWNSETALTANLFHVTEEFSIERTGSHETRRPDIVLFVNGIPLAVIECKRPDSKEPLVEAISQHLRNQREDEIPKLFFFAQVLMAVSTNEAKFGTVGTPAKFWSVWREEKERDEVTRGLVNKRLASRDRARLFQDRYQYVREYFERLEAGEREVTAQDRALVALCRPERLLELTSRYILFDAGEKKIARYQQYFCVRKILERIRTERRGAGASIARKGGVVWHTQGSGKSLTMVMLAKAIALESGIEDFKIVLVTDRVDLDDQIYDTFRGCGVEPVQASSGRHLAELLGGHRSQIITTVIDKFEAASQKASPNADANIFVLVDEGHRSQHGKQFAGQFGTLHTQMRKVLPNACFIGFTGTPILKNEKSTIQLFGGLIDAYTITQAVKDRAVVPLLYEGRHSDQIVDHDSVDSWFEKMTEKLSPAQKADLKRKFATTNQLNKAEQRVMRIAWDVSVHFRDTWQGTSFKGQLVTPDKSTALLYKKYLDEFRMVSSEVLISPPDDRKDNEEVGANLKAVQAFWKRMMERFVSEKDYKKQIINAFKHADEPEIIIVVDMLLTGFDAPRNSVLYLAKEMQGHGLLQAIARVNRLADGKDFGYIIDYCGVLQKLGEALDLYGKLPEFDKDGLEDLGHALTDIGAETARLPQRHTDLWDVFKTIRNRRDEESYERLLADDVIRDNFYERLTAYARTLAIALSSSSFLDSTPEKKVEKYKKDLKYFIHLRTSVRRRYSEIVDFKEYEERIRKLVDTHVGAGEIETLTGLVNIFDAEAFGREVEKLESTAARADTIAHRTKATIHERMDEDPAFYEKFSKLLEEAIRAFRAERLSDAEYLKRVSEISEKVIHRTGDEIPKELENHEAARAYYGVLIEFLEESVDEKFRSQVGVEASLEIDRIVDEHRIVNWTSNPDVQNRMKGAIEDRLFEIMERHGFKIEFADIDKIMEHCLGIARSRFGS
jgi:type I restriction enzyme R subunit